MTIKHDNYRYKPINRHLSLCYEGKDDPLVFVQLADTQIGMVRAFDARIEGWQRELNTARRAIEAINLLKPAFAIICGDLIDEWPSGDSKIREAQLNDFTALLDLVDTDIPLICICGNHDIGNRPNAHTISRYTSTFGDDYFTFTVGSVKGVVLNSQLFQDATDCPEARQSHQIWLERVLQEAKTDPTQTLFLFSHIAPFIRNADEKDDYFNLPKDARSHLLELSRAAGCKKWFAGHYHRNAGGWYNDLEVVVSGSLGCQLSNGEGDPLGLSGVGTVLSEDDCGARVVTISSREITHEWLPIADFEVFCQESKKMT